ncbi:MAG: hypothetical protein JWR07_1551 [Nevskia sp.]|jgi:hypothetical protein|nr:hypothetical protein [Nevskia sp.]
MTADKFIRRSQMISEHLAQVAASRECLHWDGALHPVNPQFREVLQAQERLLTALERLVEELPNRIAA